MSNINHEFDLKLMDLQAQFISSMRDYSETFTRFQFLFSDLSITPENSFMLEKYHGGLESLARASQNLSDAFKAMCSAHDIDF